MKRSLFILGIIIFLLGNSQQSYAQDLKLFDPSKNATAKPKKTKQKLATEFYVAGEYAKAAGLYEDIYKVNNSSYIYKYLLYCYINLEEYKKAEKLIKKANKVQNKSYKQLSDLGYIQLKKGELKKAERMFSEAIEELPPNHAAVNELANDYRSRGQSELAEKTYLHGKKLLDGVYTFNKELGYLYYYLEKYDKMTDSYLDLLATEPGQMRTIQYRIQNAFRRSSEEKIYPYLKSELLKRIKTEEDNPIYSDLLLWLSVQRKDFKIAAIQAKALDQREGGEYFRLFDLANVMRNNGQYTESIKALEFIASRSGAKDEANYPEVIQSLMAARYGKLQTTNNYSPEEVEKLAKQYQQTLDDLGRFKFTISTVMDYAELLFYYQNKEEEAILELENLVEHPGINRKDKAPIKLLLGDFYLLADNPWEATLLYSQVEKDFKNDEVGFDSRLKNAKLSFYIGEFDWAKAQLDIIKAATDRKISNDAMNLSLMIGENLDADSNTRALQLYGKADLLQLQKKDSLAIVTLDSIFFISLYHELHDDVWLKESEIYASNGKHQKSNELLLKILEEFPEGLLADDALWQLAEYELKNNNIEKAANYYKQILTDYPSSLFVDEARTKYRKLSASENEKTDVF